jgi:hypothetical protein
MQHAEEHLGEIKTDQAWPDNGRDVEGIREGAGLLSGQSHFIKKLVVSRVAMEILQ